MKKLSLIFIFYFSLSVIYGQKHFDFTVIDTEGQDHSLYKDYLDLGKTVVIKIFFVSCPPCNAIAKDVQQLYEEWGEGQGDVEFMEITTNRSDNDDDVERYKNTHGITFIGISADGGAREVTDQYKAGYFDTFWGTPSFAVISPNGQTEYGIFNMAQLDAQIEATGAERPSSDEQATNYQINFTWPDGHPVDWNSLQVKVASSNNPDLNFLVNPGSQGLSNIMLPDANYPAIDDPVLIIDYLDNNDLTLDVSGSDIIVLRKHILDLSPFIDEDQYLKSDVNGDGKISAIDIITMRKAILGFIDEFPNGVRSYVPNQNNIILNPNPGKTSEINVRMLKMGDLN